MLLFRFPQLRKGQICCPVAQIRNRETNVGYFLFLLTWPSLKSHQNLSFTLFPNQLLWHLPASPSLNSSTFPVLPELWVAVVWWVRKDSSRPSPCLSLQTYFYISDHKFHSSYTKFASGKQLFLYFQTIL